jgi:hypothetical protein
MMCVERQHHPGRQMVAACDHHGGARCQQVEEHGLRIGSPEVVNDDDTQILDRQGRPGHVRTLYDQLLVRDGQPCSGCRKLHRLADHRTTASVIGWTDAADGINRQFHGIPGHDPPDIRFEQRRFLRRRVHQIKE